MFFLIESIKMVDKDAVGGHSFQYSSFIIHNSRYAATPFFLPARLGECTISKNNDRTKTFNLPTTPNASQKQSGQPARIPGSVGLVWGRIILASVFGHFLGKCKKCQKYASDLFKYIIPQALFKLVILVCWWQHFTPSFFEAKKRSKKTLKNTALQLAASKHQGHNVETKCTLTKYYEHF